MALRNKNHRPMTWNDKRRGRTPNYKYSTIKEVLDNRCSSNCNVYGVVFDLKTPTQSRGSDFFALIIIVDPSAKRPLKIRLFHRDLNYFPKVECGDIVRVHRLKLYNYMGDVSLTSTKGWSWVLWKHSDADNPVKKELAGSSSYTLLKSDEEMVDRLRLWQKQYPNIATDWNFQRQMTISQIDHDDHCIVYCQIVDFVEDGSCCYARIWDGTKPSIEFHQHPLDETDESSRLGIPEGYAVDVAVSADHYAHMKSLGIAKGDFVMFTGLHAFPNHHTSNGNEKKCSELSLYEGEANGRGVTFVPQNEQYDRLESYIAHAKAIDDGSQDTLELLKQLDNHDMPQSPKRLRLSEEICNTGPTFEDAGDGDSVILQEESQTEAPTVTSKSSHDSATDISGDRLPVEMSSLNIVLHKDVPLSESRLFRVRIRMLSANTAKNGWVGHYSPNTSMFFPSQNNGKHLKITSEVAKFVKSWRQVSRKNENLSCEQLDSVESQPASQWQIPSSDGNTAAVETQNYVNPKDGSRWKSMKMENFLLRKRKLERDEFSILYIFQPEDFSPDELLKYKSNYCRVVRVLPLGVLTSNAPPAVGIQDDVFYYCCPANANLPVVPSLKEEANSFQRSRISKVAGSPVLVPRYDMTFRVQDDTGVLDKLSVSGKSAVEFFWGVTPQVYLAKAEHYADLLSSTLEDLIQNQHPMECIIEKKSRKNLHDLTKRVYSYEIVHTSLKKQISNT